MNTESVRECSPESHLNGEYVSSKRRAPKIPSASLKCTGFELTLSRNDLIKINFISADQSAAHMHNSTKCAAFSNRS